MFCTEMHGDFLKWIVMREIHRGATLYFFVSSFTHTIVILSELVLSFVEMKANGNSFCTEIHGDFLKWIVMRELEKGKGIFLMEMI